MAQSKKPWHICDDCLDPLAHGLLLIAHRMPIFFDVAEHDRLDAEYQQIFESSSYCADGLTDVQRKRRDELVEQMRSQTRPPTSIDLYRLDRKYHIQRAIDWLKFNVSVEYADDFKRTLPDAETRFRALEFKASQIINGDEGKESTILLRYAIQRLLERHRELLREMFPDHEHRPDREELPDALRAFEVEILDEYGEIENEIREAGRYLQRVSSLVRSKMKKADVGEIQQQIAEGIQAAQAGLAGIDITDASIEAGNAAHREDEAGETPSRSNTAHSPDFRSVRWFGTEFTFTTTQAACIKILWENWERGTPVISEVTILDEAGSSGDRLRDVFRKGKHPAWGPLIKPAQKGAFQLAERNES